MFRKRRSLANRLRWIMVSTLGVVVIAPVALALLFREVPPPVTPLMVIRLFEGEGIKKDWVPLAEISPNLVEAVIALEDNTFCSHAGVDWGQLFAALSDYYKGERLRGASTITMQTAKNLYLWPGRDVLRKAAEAPLTVMLEALWDKRRILEVYLNVAEWGPGIYGAEAAARAHFGKPASRLNRREAALLAAVLPNPREWSPARPTAYLLGRVRVTRDRVSNLGPLLTCTRA
jgi:monofunctional biosynthetic peptidoglycan transglycosylase